MRIKRCFFVRLILVFGLIFTSFTASASNDADDTFCPGLDYKNRFEKKLIGELDVFAGGYLGNYILTGWAAGGRLFMHLNHFFALGGEYMYTPPSVDSISSFGLVKKTNTQQMIDGQIAFSWPILFGFGRNELPMDLFFTLGAGTININEMWSWLAVIGGGLKIYLNPEWMAVRIDVNSYMHNTPTVSGNKFSTNLAFLVGLAFYFPYKPAR
jgi:hypothetical protein